MYKNHSKRGTSKKASLDAAYVIGKISFKFLCKVLYLCIYMYVTGSDNIRFIGKWKRQKVCVTCEVAPCALPGVSPRPGSPFGGRYWNMVI